MDGVTLRGALVGVMAATVTPFRSDGRSVDWEGVESNAAWLVDQGVRVLVVNGSIGEYPYLPRDDRVRAVGDTVDAARGSALVVAGCSDPRPDESIALFAGAADAGADAVMIMLPHYFRLTNDEILDFFTMVAKQSPLPWIVYNNASVTGFEIPIDVILEICRFRGCVGFKEASTDVLRFYELKQRLEAGFPLIAASESTLFFTLLAGAQGCMTATAAFAPSILQALMTSVERSDLDDSRMTFDRLHMFRQLLQPSLDRGVPAYIPYTKAAMNLVGLRGGVPHYPMRPLTDRECAALRVVLRDRLQLPVVV